MLINTNRGRNDLADIPFYIHVYTTFTNFSMKYHVMCKVYTGVGGIK